MTTIGSLASLERWLTAPPTAYALSRRFVGSALANARRSLEDITAAVNDRSTLGADITQSDERGHLSRLSAATCMELLASKRVGRIAYIARAGHPDIVPVNYLLHGQDILIASGPGPKLQAAERRELVALEVDEIDEADRSGWSVLVVGRAERLSAVEAAQLPEPLPWAHGPRRHVVRITPRRLDGRHLF